MLLIGLNYKNIDRLKKRTKYKVVV